MLLRKEFGLRVSKRDPAELPNSSMLGIHREETGLAKSRGTSNIPPLILCAHRTKKGHVFIYEALEYRIAWRRKQDPGDRIYHTNISDRLQTPCERIV